MVIYARTKIDVGNIRKYSKTPDECDPYTNFALLMKQTSASVTLDILNEYHKTFIEKK